MTYTLLIALFCIYSVGSQTNPDSVGSQILFTDALSPNQRVQISLFFSTKTMRMTYYGPSNVWYGIGFNNTFMQNAYSIIIDGTGAVSERQLANNAQGIGLKSTTTIVSNTVNGTTRELVLTRPMDITGARATDYYDFVASAQQSFSIIFAYGMTPQPAYHQNRSDSTFTMNPPSFN
eukprot:84030_1